jgi:hypothetical protein
MPVKRVVGLANANIVSGNATVADAWPAGWRAVLAAKNFLSSFLVVFIRGQA